MMLFSLLSLVWVFRTPPSSSSQPWRWRPCHALEKEIEIKIISSCQNFIDTLIRAEGKTFYGSFFYGEPDISKRKLIWSQLIDLGKTRVEPWFITGDFNDIIESSEKQGGLERPDGSIVDLRSFMS